jgi:sulfonate transport system permease protein
MSGTAHVPSFGVDAVTKTARWALGPALILAAWQLAASAGWLDPDTIASPAATWQSWLDMLRDGSFADALAASLTRVAIGLMIGVIAGLTLAIVAASSWLGQSLVDGPMQILRALPILALQPLALLWFGIGEGFKIFLIAFAASIPIYLNTLAAIHGVERRFMELAEVLELSRLRVLGRIILPGALPGFLTGLRYATAVALLVLVVGEQVNATSGLGYLMNRAILSARTDVILVGLVTYGVLGLLSDVMLRALEGALLQWRKPVTGR